MSFYKETVTVIVFVLVQFSVKWDGIYPVHQIVTNSNNSTIDYKVVQTIMYGTMQTHVYHILEDIADRQKQITYQNRTNYYNRWILPNTKQISRQNKQHIKRLEADLNTAINTINSMSDNFTNVDNLFAQQLKLNSVNSWKMDTTKRSLDRYAKLMIKVHMQMITSRMEDTAEGRSKMRQLLGKTRMIQKENRKCRSELEHHLQKNKRIIGVVVIISAIQFILLVILWTKTTKQDHQVNVHETNHVVPAPNHHPVPAPNHHPVPADLGVVTFNRETSEKAEKMVANLKTFKHKPETIFVQGDQDYSNLIACKYYVIWVDCGSRNTILEKPNRGEGSLRRDTLQRAKTLGGTIVLVCFGHGPSKTITGLYADTELDVTADPLVKHLVDNDRFFSVDRELNSSQKAKLVELLHDI